MSNLPITIRTPMFGVVSTEPCWRCKEQQPIVALGCLWLSDEGEPNAAAPQQFPSFVMLNNIRDLPLEILVALRVLQPNYQKRESRTTGECYYVNICTRCDAHFGDFFLFSEPSQGFWPDTDAGYRGITIRRLPLEGEFQLEAGYSLSGDLDLWEKCVVLTPDGQPDDQLKKEVRDGAAAAEAAWQASEKARRSQKRRSKKP